MTFTGYLSSYLDNLELDADLQNNLATGGTVLSNNKRMPTPKLIAWDSLATNGNANFQYNVEGSLVMLTNVYFSTNAGTSTGTANLNCLVTNASGKVGHVYFYAGQDGDVASQTIPAFAYAVVGPLIQATNAAVPAGYLVAPTRWADIVTAVPSLTLDNPANGASFTAPASITLSATVTSNGYPISAVKFYNGATLVGSATPRPTPTPGTGLAPAATTSQPRPFIPCTALTSPQLRESTL